jgi:xylan 1,4-beta-xylosidase
MRITIDRNIGTVPTDFSWQIGLGNDHAYQLHRTDVCEHIKLAHDELGIKYIRCHGIFDDDMLTYQRMGDCRMFRSVPFNNKIEEINFRQVGHVYDNLLACGVKPFVELSFMPSALASGKKLGLRYDPNITMPKSLVTWGEYIKKFIHFLIDRYGADEVETWYFEVWNEPDLDCFFAGTKKDYFKLYEATVRAIKEVSPKLRVGGPSTSACLWIEDFLNFCKENNVPCDFVSTHHYPGDAFGNFVNFKNVKQMFSSAMDAVKNHKPLSDTMTNMFFLPDDFIRWDKGTLARMDDEAKGKVGDMPLFITEWNSMAVFGSPVHDEKYSAAFAVKSCMDLNNTLGGYMFWCCSDIFEEQFMLPKPFVGSFGIVSNDGIPKPNFWGFKILSQLYNKRLTLPMRTNEAVEYAAFVDGDKTQVLVYAQDQDYFKNETHEISIVVNCKATSVTVQRIDDIHCNPKAEWIRLGKPDNLTPTQVAQIKEKTALKAENVDFVSENEETRINLSIKTNDVVLLNIE